jgi:hypothetical protein
MALGGEGTRGGGGEDLVREKMAADGRSVPAGAAEPPSLSSASPVASDNHRLDSTTALGSGDRVREAMAATAGRSVPADAVMTGALSPTGAAGPAPVIAMTLRTSLTARSTSASAAWTLRRISAMFGKVDSVMTRVRRDSSRIRSILSPTSPEWLGGEDRAVALMVTMASPEGPVNGWKRGVEMERERPGTGL